MALIDFIRRPTTTDVTSGPEVTAKSARVVEGPAVDRFPDSMEAKQSLSRAQTYSDQMIGELKKVMPQATPEQLAQGDAVPEGSKEGGTSIGWHEKANGFKVMAKPNYGKDEDMDVNDIFANTLRTVAGSAALGVAERTTAVTDEKDPLVIRDYVRARMDGLDQNFTNKVKTWSPAQLFAVTEDIPWALFLEDFDKGTKQYKVLKLDDKQLATACGDWDHAQVEVDGQTGVDKPLDRYTSFANFPTAQVLAFIDHVRGKIDIDYDVMRATVERMQKNITQADVEKAVEPYMQKHYGAMAPEEFAAKKETVVNGVMGRLGNLESVVEGFIQVLDAERTERANGEMPLGERLRSGVKDTWKRMEGWYGASNLMNETYNKFNRLHRNATVEIPEYRASDLSKPVGNISAKDLLDMLTKQAEAAKEEKKAKT